MQSGKDCGGGWGQEKDVKRYQFKILVEGENQVRLIGDIGRCDLPVLMNITDFKTVSTEKQDSGVVGYRELVLVVTMRPV